MTEGRRKIFIRELLARRQPARAAGHPGWAAVMNTVKVSGECQEIKGLAKEMCLARGKAWMDLTQ